MAEKPYRCRSCAKSDFKRHPKSGIRYCPSCTNERNRRWYETHRDRVAELRKQKQPTPEFKRYARGWQLRRRYGISRAEYDALLFAQSGVCAVCQSPPSAHRNLNVDHCHATGTVRGLLCDQCNNGLARFKDNEEFLWRAIQYLKQSRTTEIS